MEGTGAVSHQPIAMVYKRNELLQFHPTGNIGHVMGDGIEDRLEQLPLFLCTGNEDIKSFLVL